MFSHPGRVSPRLGHTRPSVAGVGRTVASGPTLARPVTGSGRAVGPTPPPEVRPSAALAESTATKAIRALLLAVVLSFALLPGVRSAAAQSMGSFLDVPPPYQNPEGAVVVLERLRVSHPGRIDVHLASAREHLVLGVLAPDRKDGLALLEQSAGAARAAVAVDSTSAEGYYWLAAALGLRADEEQGRTKMTLARDAYAATLRSLELDPAHPGALHVLGRLHTGAKNLSWLNRLVARGLGLGDLIGQASWESAEHNLRMAAEGDPDAWVNALELGRVLLHVGKTDEGRRVLEDLAARSPRHPFDAHFVAEARRLLGGAPGQR